MHHVSSCRGCLTGKIQELVKVMVDLDDSVKNTEWLHKHCERHLADKAGGNKLQSDQFSEELVFMQDGTQHAVNWGDVTAASLMTYKAEVVL